MKTIIILNYFRCNSGRTESRIQPYNSEYNRIGLQAKEGWLYSGYGGGGGEILGRLCMDAECLTVESYLE